MQKWGGENISFTGNVNIENHIFVIVSTNTSLNFEGEHSERRNKMYQIWIFRVAILEKNYFQHVFPEEEEPGMQKCFLEFWLVNNQHPGSSQNYSVRKTLSRRLPNVRINSNLKKKSNSRRNNLPHLCYFITEILYINYSLLSNKIWSNFLSSLEVEIQGKTFGGVKIKMYPLSDNTSAEINCLQIFTDKNDVFNEDNNFPFYYS